MRLPDGSVLMHGSAPYDKTKAHEYYMRTRKLKGRKKGSQVLVPGPAKGRPMAGTKKPNPQELAKQRALATQRVNEIRGKLAELNTRLKKAMADAKEADQKKKAGPTAADKSKAARESKQYRDKHKTELKAKGKKAAEKDTASDKPKADTVESLQKTIAEVKGRLTAALEKQRQLS
jgi:hypothetical protein